MTSTSEKSVAVLAGLAGAGAVGASAASLGGLGGEDLGAETGDGASCDTDAIDVDWAPFFDPPAGQYVALFALRDIKTDCLATRDKIAIFLTSYRSNFPVELVEGIALEIGGQQIRPR